MELFNKVLGGREPAPRSEELKQIAIKDIHVNPQQPRKTFDPGQLEELSQSIREYGVLQPIVVRKIGGTYELIAGERRLRAAAKAGLEKIPAIVKTMNEKDVAIVALIENLQREDLNYFEEAEGYANLIKNYALTQEELARSIGKSQSAIANKMRLLKLSENVRKRISQEILTERHARSLLKLAEDKDQIAVIEKIMENNLNVRDTEALIDAVIADKQRGIGDKIIPIKKKKRITGIVKDIRIYLNAIRSTVKTMREAGLDVVLEESERGGAMEFKVVIKAAKGHEQA